MERLNSPRGGNEAEGLGRMVCEKLCVLKEIVSRMGYPKEIELLDFPEQIIETKEMYIEEDDDGSSWLSQECVLRCPTCQGEAFIEHVRNNVMEVWGSVRANQPTLRRCTEQEPFDLVAINRADRHELPPESSAD